MKGLDQNTEIQNDPSVTNDIDDAVGLPSSHWFVALVRHNTEKKIRDDLEKNGYKAYVAAQPRLRIYPSGRKKWVDRIVIPSKIFINCTEKERLQIVHHPFIYRFLTDPSAKPTNGHKAVAVIPQKEIETLRFMLGQSDYPVDFEEMVFQTGEPVKVIRGSLKGLEGKVIESSKDNKTIIIQLDLLGCAKLSLPTSDIHPLK